MKYLAIAIGIVVLGAGAYFFMQSDSEGDTSQNNQSYSSESDESINGSIKDLLALGKNITCTFSSVEADTTMNGVVYVADQKVRGDFTIVGAGSETLELHAIRDGGYSYSWGTTPFGPIATKVSIEEADAGQDKDAAFDPNEKVDFDCSKWRVDASQFVLPSDIDFDDITPGVKQINESTNTVNDLKCSACDQAPAGPSRDACRASLGCS